MMVNEPHSTSPEIMQSLSWKQIAANSFIISPGADGNIRKQVEKVLADLYVPKHSREQVVDSIIRVVLDFSADLGTENILTPKGAVHFRIFLSRILNQGENSAPSSLSWGFFLVQNRTSQPGSQKLSLDIFLYQE